MINIMGIHKFPKTVAVLIAVAITLSLSNQKVKAATIYSASVKDSYTPVRTGQSSKTKKLGTLKRGSSLIIYNKEKNGWSEILYKDIKAYVYSKHLSFRAGLVTGAIKSKTAIVRAKATSKGKKLGVLKLNSKVTVYNQTKSGWAQIRYKNKTGYIPVKDLNKITKLKTVAATVKINTITVRNTASSKGKRVGTLKKKTKLTVYSRLSSGWSEIRYKNKKAYVLTKGLTISVSELAKPMKPVKTSPAPPKPTKPATNPPTPVKSKPTTPPVETVPTAPIVNPASFLFISHRGASGLFPEHTFEAYDEAIRLKTDYIEIDLHMTKDGQFIAMHDGTLDRTTNGTGNISDYTLEEIKQLDAGIKFYKKPTNINVPSLDEIFKRYGNSIKYYIETKDSPGDTEMNYEKKLLDLVQTNNINPENIIFQSFSLHSLENIHSLDPSNQFKLVQLFSFQNKSQISMDAFEQISTIGYGVGINYQVVDGDIAQAIRDKNLQLHVWTVNSEQEMKQLIGYGVTGIFTNYPNLLQKILIERGMR